MILQRLKIEEECLLAVALFILFSISLPIYDKVNGFHNLLFDNFKLVWYDGRSPLNFYIIKNIIKENKISFEKGYLIDGIPVESFFDLRRNENDGRYYPVFSVLSNYIFAAILYPFRSLDDLQLFKSIVIINIFLYSILLIVFYYTQKTLGIKSSYASLSTFVCSIATSILIYSRYLFISDTFIWLTFFVLVYLIVKKWKNKDGEDIWVILSSLLFFVFLENVVFILMVSTALGYFLLKYKMIKNVKLYLLSVFLAISFVYFFRTFILGLTQKSLSSIKLYGYGGPLFVVFPNFIPALDFEIYGYYNISSAFRTLRIYPQLLYSFEEPPGNAIFLYLYGVFSFIFGPKGFVYNSIFLIFSIFGMFLYKDKIKMFIIWVLIFYILFLCIWYGIWYGGVTPRYNRFSTLPAMFLTFFSFYYIQEISKKKSRNKWVVYTIFTILVILSVLNVTSLAIRADWNYEHEADLFSYDLVLWPWYPPKEETTNETTILLTSAEIPKWTLGGEGNCKASFGSIGLVTDPCLCRYDSWAERKIELENISAIKIEACASLAGNDGTKGLILIDEKLIGEIFIESYSCSKKTFQVNVTPGVHTIKLKSGIYGVCNGEGIFWRSLAFK